MLAVWTASDRIRHLVLVRQSRNALWLRLEAGYGFKKRRQGWTRLRHGTRLKTLLAEHKANTTFKPFDRPHGPATISDAYDIQQKFVELLRAEHGDTIGYKVGLTSEPMQKFCGIDHPIAGVVLARRVHQSGATVRRAEFGRLGLEFEIAVRIKSNVPATASPHTAKSIEPYIGGVGAAIELVDDRAADYTHSRRSGAAGG